MRKPKTLLVIACLLALGPAMPARAVGSCYQRSDLDFFQQVVEIVEAWPDSPRGCWHVRLRLRGRTSPQGHAMICGGNACDPSLPLREGVYWRDGSPLNENIYRVIREENGSCTDVSFCIVPQSASDTLLIDFAALFEESYFLSSPRWQPRWSGGAIDLSSLDGTKSHCQDGEPLGAVCLEP
jgi:hypothetical protein